MQTLNVRISGVPDPVVVKVPSMGYIRGRDGKDGEDGFSPIVDVEDVEGGHEITITDKEGEHSFLVKDGGAGTFFAIYGVTTLDELDAAFDAGKNIIVVRDIPLNLLVYYTLARRYKYVPQGEENAVNAYSFATCYGDNALYTCECKADGWTENTIWVATYEYVALNAVLQYQGLGNAGKLLAVGNDGDVTLIPNTYGAGSFVAVYGTTTQAELDEAYNAGKTMLCRLPSGWLAALQQVVTFAPGSGTGNTYVFVSLYTRFEVRASFANGVWSSTEYTLAQEEEVVLKDQGRGNAGKFLGIDNNGEVVPVSVENNAGTFIAEYGTTTLAQLDAAYAAGKTIFAHQLIPFNLDVWYIITRRTAAQEGNVYSFAAWSTYGDSAVYLCQCDTNGWTGSRADLSGAAFLAVYGVTTQAELDEAYNAGKTMLCRLPSGWFAQLQQVVTFAPGSGAGNTYVFVALSTRYEVLASFANGAWSSTEYTFAQEERVVLKNQGRGNAGKVLVVASNGEVEPGDPPGSVRKGTISLSAQWDGDGLYTQAVTVPGIPVTANSKVDLQPDMEEIEQLAGDGVAALYVENNNGVLTACAAGAAPSSAMTLQCTVTEVRA